jgi:DnaA family protein
MKQIALQLRADAAPAFDNFIVGAGNAAALAQLQALDRGAPPLYLWGPPGSGKTHLLHALTARWRNAGRRAARFDAATPLPWAADADLLLLDDCDAFDAARQHAAFALFVQGGATVVAAGRLPPVDLPLRDDLRTRLGWGPVFALQPLAEREVRAALRGDAERRGLRLPDEVLDHLLTRHARDLGTLSALLERLDAYALQAKRAPTLPLLKQMLAEQA